jgi:cyclopropane-fatty-acyl-phospholipid synthase
MSLEEEQMKGKKERLLGVPFDYEATDATDQSPPTALEKGLMRLILRALGDPQIKVILWDGEALDPVDAPAMVLRERAALWRLLYYPTLHFGDDYSAGRIDIEGGLEQFLSRFYTAYRRQPKLMDALQQGLNRYRHLRGNPQHRARDNIYHHYDIGNDFYRLWLDEEMVYTCAYYAPGITTLEAAQQAKMEHVCRKLRLKPGDTVVDAGCGWGALARYMAKHYDVHVRAFNVSHEQVAYARDKARAEGLEGRVEFIEDDYRNISGHYDAFVSIGMLEHVGSKHYRQLGGIIDRSLKANGRGLIHTIGQNRPIPTSTWTQRRIFPGGYPPTLGEMSEIFSPYDFSILDVENLRPHYAQTLRHWLARFDQRQDEVSRMYDECFVRTWRLYLTGSIANFASGYLQLFQVLFTRPQNNELPTTRDDIYDGEY